MINSYINAKLTSYKTFRVFVFSEAKLNKLTKIKLIENDTNLVDLVIKKRSHLSGLELIDCEVKGQIVLGNNYFVSIDGFGMTALDMSEATNFPDFDKDYYYDKKDLGVTYSVFKSTFKIWAPLASKVVLLVKTKDDWVTYKMKREDKGVYTHTVLGNLNKALYRYQITNSGITLQATDPYAKASTANGRDSVVIDFNKVKMEMYDNVPPLTKGYQNSIIYELSVRDFTIDNTTNIEHKGKFLGLVEPERKTKGGNECGLDYLKTLPITHVQILPIYDFKTTDELNPLHTYNWGYDPQQYFVPEGSYSTDPNDGYARIIECKKMISELHKAGLKVNMDVVFNHVFGHDQSVFEKVVPNYYFRKNSDGTIANGSGCGNELDTTRPMVRKMIVDCCKYWIDEYHVDGYRFDLMGLIDQKTVYEIYHYGVSKKKDFMIYGEGWNMGNVLPESERTTIMNSFKTPEFAFFNDTFRDILKGHSGYGSGYLTGNTSYLEGFKYVLLGSALDFCYRPRFISTAQSINYVECHDNMTLFDKISKTLTNIKEDEVLKLVKMNNATIAISFGIPFFHAGQEIGLTKKGEDNTYNKGDEYNKFDWRMLDKRYELYLYFKSLLKFRHERNYDVDNKKIEKNNMFYNYENGSLGFEIKKGVIDNLNDYLFIFNPNDKLLKLDLDDYYNVLIGTAGYMPNSEIVAKRVEIPARTFVAAIKKKG